MGLLRRARALVALGFACPLAARAQSPVPRPATGQRIRVERLDGPRLTGNVVAWSADTVGIEAHGTRRVTLVPVASIVRYEVSVGRDRRRGALRGLIVGSVVGASVMVAVTSADRNNSYAPPMAVVVPIGAVLFGATGAGLGALIGTERWESPSASATMGIPRRFGATVLPRAPSGLAAW
jgi:hypothetical protein